MWLLCGCCGVVVVVVVVVLLCGCCGVFFVKKAILSFFGPFFFKGVLGAALLLFPLGFLCAFLFVFSLLFGLFLVPGDHGEERGRGS